MSTSTAQLLDLTARAAGTTDPGALLEMLQAGHTLVRGRGRAPRPHRRALRRDVRPGGG